MFKDYDKYLSTSLKVYLFILIIIFILKLVGFDYFGLQIDHPMIVKINEFCKTFKLDIIISYLNCFINFYIVISIMCNENGKKIKLYTLLWLPIIIIFQYLKAVINNPLMHIISDYILTILICYIRTKKLQIKKFTILTVFIVLCQFISMIIRSQSLNSNTYNFAISLLMNLDFLIMIILLYKLYFMRGGKVCYQVEEAISCATNKSWDYVYDYLSDIAQYEGTLLDKREFVRNYLDRTYKRIEGINGSVGYVSSLFPNNVILITMNGHITCSKYGIIYDTFDCRNREVENIWLVI